MEGKEIVGVVRKVVFKDRNGGYDLDSCIKDGVKCYLYIDYIDESIEDPKKQLQMLVLEDVYYSVSSIIKLKFVDGKWHLLTELNRYSIIEDGPLYDFCKCDKWYQYISKDREEMSKLNDKVRLEELSEFDEQLRITGEQNSAIIEKDPTGFLEKIEDMDSFSLYSDFEIVKHEFIEMFNEGIDFNKKKFIEILDRKLFGSDFQSSRFYTKNLYYLLTSILRCLDEKNLYTPQLIGIAGLSLDFLNYMDLLTSAINSSNGSKTIGEIEDDEYYTKLYLSVLISSLNLIIDAKVIDCDRPIISQIKEDLKQKQLVFKQRLKRYYEK